MKDLTWADIQRMAKGETPDMTIGELKELIADMPDDEKVGVILENVSEHEAENMGNGDLLKIVDVGFRQELKHHVLIAEVETLAAV